MLTVPPYNESGPIKLMSMGGRQGMLYHDEELAKQFKDPGHARQFGKYLGTYTDDDEQVIVDLCLERTGVTAHVQLQNGLRDEDITANWWEAINTLVRELGYPRVFKVNHGYSYYE
jgi:hypothetical protein